MSKINTPMNKSIQKFKNHKRIETQRKQSLINLVITENVSTRQAAQKLSIKYSTAKYIMKNFKMKGNYLEAHQHTQSKQKSIIQNVNIIIDVSDGSILLAKNNQKISYCDFSSLQEQYKNQNLLQTSELIYEKLGKISWRQFHYKECRNEEMLKKFLLRQHIQMKQK
ncbi:unnamed protein product [Paramecium sonneborni]|uniref:Uncharacterized protein n=1 Tax=Paramecium sonneborni TaxID=65129 RepID=A0A8S1QIK2_9CILI|nr:unnamed protein product [Paramecium sonneborni]CAD8114862.1 unnamed protein product [Paramecium sonneborni]